MMNTDIISYYSLLNSTANQNLLFITKLYSVTKITNQNLNYNTSVTKIKLYQYI